MRREGHTSMSLGERIDTFIVDQVPDFDISERCNEESFVIRGQDHAID